jgi:hypothetical protein
MRVSEAGWCGIESVVWQGNRNSMGAGRAPNLAATGLTGWLAAALGAFAHESQPAEMSHKVHTHARTSARTVCTNVLTTGVFTTRTSTNVLECTALY